ncbi:hypothetical protein KRP22_010100 [Phytophthora ramorum]|uniref:uncharacterized protein n=1 Tax=Phytophthora ramorum TaxID=164328 RepID=UPI0030AC2750|nr:hypothetical protein KRP23_6649 [Phytophthora ramorum]KAH7505559.1 hypothetical protein KRP22_6030 [Phytophthora ramorum]
MGIDVLLAVLDHGEWGSSSSRCWKEASESATDAETTFVLALATEICFCIGQVNASAQVTGMDTAQHLVTETDGGEPGTKNSIFGATAASILEGTGLGSWGTRLAWRRNGDEGRPSNSG